MAAALILAVLFAGGVYANEEEMILNARAAVLMDAESGRVLYSKDGETAYPLASTTKVMTLVIALENADADTIVTASDYAASMPEVRLGVRKGEQYRLGDLYYALMLESYNDAAVMIAEAVAGSVEDFAGLMNEKAALLGCTSTHFITPNGLDASDAGGAHASSAKDLALIMRYAIGNDAFLEITRTRSYTFSDTSGQRSFSLNNKNALFDMMDGVISGKTGFTGGAGYCYVCAVDVGDKRLIAALLGSGWPPNKNYKWQDVKKLMAYGDSHFEYQTVHMTDYLKSEKLQVTGGLAETAELVPVPVSYRILMGDGERLHTTVHLPGQLAAPVTNGEEVGTASLYIDDCLIGQSAYSVNETVAKKDCYFYLNNVWHAFIIR